jgi:hypothetical protein
MTSGHRPPATTVTFYSYKGGTGRSMALANLAWILAMNGRRVLAIDWDLEAPGLHRYFRPFLIDKDLTSSTGVIDFVIAFAEQAVQLEDASEQSSGDGSPASTDPKWYAPYADISAHAVSLEWTFADGGGIDFVCAGRQDATYATRVSTFNWQSFYTNLGGGALIDEMRRLLRRTEDPGNPHFEPYDFVLIDSRTGVSDTAGICTVQLPDVLVACFTYNNQGTDGAAAVAWSAQQQRLDPINARGGLRELLVYPVPMRVDPFERGRLAIRQEYAWQIFDRFLGHVPESRRKAYRTDVEVPYVPLLSYEELLAVFLDEPEDPKFALGAFRRFAGYAFGEQYTTLPAMDPEERQRVLREFASLSGLPAIIAPSAESGGDASARRAEAVFQRLDPDHQRYAKLLWLTMVRVTEKFETADLGVVRVRESDVPKAYAPAIAAFLDGGVITRETAGDVGYLAPASPSVVSVWPRLKAWIDEERAFLMWRQRLRARVEAKRNNDPDAEFLRGAEVAEALRWSSGRKASYFLPSESQFIWSSALRYYARAGAVAAMLFAALLTLAPVRASLLTAMGALGIHFPSSASDPLPAVPSKEAALRAETLVKRALALPDDPLTAALVLAEVEVEPANASHYRAQTRARLRDVVPQVVFRGHAGSVFTVDFSPDGTLLLTAGNDERVGIWGAAAGDLRTWLPTLSAPLTILSSYPPEKTRFAPPAARFIDASTIVAVNPRSVAFFNAASGRLSAAVESFKDARLAGVCRELGGAVIASDKQKGRVSVISTRGDSIIRPLRFTGLQSLAVGPGVLLAVNSDNKVRFWTLTGGSQAGITRKQLADVGPMAFQPDGNTLFVASRDWVWRAEPTSRVSRGFQLPFGAITAIAVDRGGKRVAAGNGDGRVIVYDANLGVIQRQFVAQGGPILDIRFSPDGERLATAADDGTVRVWPLNAPPIPPQTFVAMARSIAARTTVCLSREQRALLLGENAATAQAGTARCEQRYGRVGISGQPPGGTSGNPPSDNF